MDYGDFPNNKYATQYVKLMESRRFQDKEKFKTESHHIFPVSIFGKNSITVNLTHREHYIAHLLLWKMYDKNSENYYKMLFVFKSMCELSNKYNNRDIGYVNSKLYEKYREEFRKANSIYTKFRWDNDKDFRENQIKHNQQYWANEENRKAQSERRKVYFEDEENRTRQTKINQEITSRESWKKQRSETQKRLCEDEEYVKTRISAMSTPEAKRKSWESNQKRIDAMTPEERKKRYARSKTKEQRENHSNKLKNRKKIVNPKTHEKRLVNTDGISLYSGWLIWKDLTTEQKRLYK